MSTSAGQDAVVASHSESVGDRAKIGTIWIVSGFGLGQILRLVANVALAHILFEEAFAMMAIVTGVMMGLGMFSDIGLQANVVQNTRGDEPDFLNTAWTLQVLRGLVLFTIASLLAWPISQFYGANDPAAYDLLYLIPIVALTALISGFFSTKMMVASRHLKIKELTLIEFILGPFNVLAMLVLAWYMRSVYALAIASVLTTILQLILSYRMLEGPPSRFRWDNESVRVIISFGKWIFVSTFFTFLAMQVDRLAMAGMFPLAQVGVYAIAASLAIIVPTLVGRLQWSILFPWYSRMLEQGMSLPLAFGKTRTATMVFSSFFCVLLIAGASSFFDLAYDDRYKLGGVLLPLLALGAWFSCLENMYGSAFVASGRPKWTAFTNASKAATFLLLLVPISLLDLDIVVAATFLSLSEFTRWLVCHWLGRRLGLRNARAELGMLAYFLLTSGAGWWLLVYSPFVSDLHAVWKLLILMVAACLAYTPLFFRFVLPLLKRR